jgi:hypothetical protein
MNLPAAIFTLVADGVLVGCGSLKPGMSMSDKDKQAQESYYLPNCAMHQPSISGQILVLPPRPH